MTTGVDLLLFERHGNPGGCGGLGCIDPEVPVVERLYYSLLQKLNTSDSVAPPPLVLMNFAWLLREGQKDDGCTRGYGANCGRCNATDLRLMSDRLYYQYNAGPEVQLRAAATYYGWASLSMRDMILAGLRDGAHTRLGWSECEFVTSFYSDFVHVSPAGTRFLGDVLLQMLTSAQDAAGEIEGAESGPDASAPHRMPKSPIAPGAWQRSLCLCYDEPVVTSNVGWMYVTHETVRGKSVHKPGFLAYTTGAELVFRVQTFFESLPRNQSVNLSVRFLTSYEHMGSALLTCVRGCACKELLLEGHSLVRDPAQVSLMQAASTAVTQAAECTLRLRVRSETLSGEHKVKMLGVTVNAQI